MAFNFLNPSSRFWEKLDKKTKIGSHPYTHILLLKTMIFINDESIAQTQTLFHWNYKGVIYICLNDASIYYIFSTYSNFQFIINLVNRIVGLFCIWRPHQATSFTVNVVDHHFFLYRLDTAAPLTLDRQTEKHLQPTLNDSLVAKL